MSRESWRPVNIAALALPLGCVVVGLWLMSSASGDLKTLGSLLFVGGLLGGKMVEISRAAAGMEGEQRTRILVRGFGLLALAYLPIVAVVYLAPSIPGPWFVASLLAAIALSAIFGKLADNVARDRLKN